jgi:RES domain-containing protein
MMSIIYRLATEMYCDDIAGNGAKLYGGRWNPIDYAMLYGASHISLAALEILVHNQSRNFYQNYILLDLQLPETTDKKIVNPNQLKLYWEFDSDYTQKIGKDFLESNLLLMHVPSIVVPREFNILVNPNHKHFSKIIVKNKELYTWDKRLI